MENFLGYVNVFTFLLGVIFLLLIKMKMPPNWGTKLAISMLVVMSFRSLVHLCIQLDIIPEMSRILGISATFHFLLPYLFYLYLSWVVNPVKSPDFSWYHWIVPLTVLFTLGLPNLDYVPNNFEVHDKLFGAINGLGATKIFVVVWIMQSVFYLTKILKLFSRVFSRINTPMATIIIPLLLITGSFVAIFLVYVGTFISSSLFSGPIVYMHVSSFFKPFFIIALFFLFYRNPILLKPQIRLFDVDMEHENKGESMHWRNEPNNGLDTQFPHHRYEDAAIVQSVIQAIEEFVRLEKPFRNPNFNLSDFSDKLNIPTAHLKFIFKEYNRLTFNDYRNFCRVLDLENVFVDPTLKHLGVDALGEICGFGSKSAIFRAVRRHYNMTPQELQFRLLSQSIYQK